MRRPSLIRPLAVLASCLNRYAVAFSALPIKSHRVSIWKWDIITPGRPVLFSSRDLNDSSPDITLTEQHERPRRSAFGKAAIGRNNKSKPVESTSRKDRLSQAYVHPIDTHISTAIPLSTQVEPSTLIHPNLDDSTVTNPLTEETKRERALHALVTNLSMTKKESSALLDAYPRIYTDIPDLSSKLFHLLHRINIKAKQLRKMIQHHPRLMETVLLDSEDHITSTVKILQTELNMSTQDIKMIEAQSLPAILNYPRSELRKRILVYKLDLMFNTDDLKTLVLKDPRVLRTDSKNVRKILEVLEDELDIGIDDIHLMIRKEILLLTYRAEENIRPTIRYLKNNEIGKCVGMVERKGSSTLSNQLTEEEKEAIIRQRLKNLVMGHPKILSSSVEKNLIPTVNFFLNHVGMSQLEFGRLIYRRGGSLLEANVDRSLRRKIEFFRQELDLIVEDVNPDTTLVPVPDVDSMEKLTASQKQRLLAQMLATNPDILTLSIESNLTPKFAYFTQTFGFSKQQLCHMLLKRPQLLALSLERNIIPKMECFLAPRHRINDNPIGLGMTKEQVRSWITVYPQTLTCQLEARMRPRIMDAVRLDLSLGKDLPYNFITRSDQSWRTIIEKIDKMIVDT